MINAGIRLLFASLLLTSTSVFAMEVPESDQTKASVLFQKDEKCEEALGLEPQSGYLSIVPTPLGRTLSGFVR